MHFGIKNAQFSTSPIILSLCKHRVFTYETNFPAFVSTIQSPICVSMSRSVDLQPLGIFVSSIHCDDELYIRRNPLWLPTTTISFRSGPNNGATRRLRLSNDSSTPHCVLHHSFVLNNDIFSGQNQEFGIATHDGGCIYLQLLPELCLMPDLWRVAMTPRYHNIQSSITQAVLIEAKAN